MNATKEKNPLVYDLPVGIDAMGTRVEFDSLGEVEVPAAHYWGAQTQRSLEHFHIGGDRMPKEVYHAFGHVKEAAALVNAKHGLIPGWMAELIGRVCDEITGGELDTDFPLFVWQTGSGTQTNMNVNEVISNRCIQLLGGDIGSQVPVHPNDHVNRSQSSNDTFPTAMHVSGHILVSEETLPALERLRDALNVRAKRWTDVVRIGRTHLQDATPLTVGQQWSGYVASLDEAIQVLEVANRGLLAIALGGTAVGTGLNTPPGFDEDASAEIARLTGFAFHPASNKFAAQATLDRMARAHAALKGVAVSLFKIANDIRWLGSGPRAGIGELILPSNEPGSSIMPGKVNPTQCEAALMVCIEVMSSDTGVQMAAAEGNFELNTFRPMVIRSFLHSARLLADMADHFRRFTIEGIELNLDRIRANVDRSAMLVTALTPEIGYQKAARIAHDAVEKDITLREAALDHGVDAETYDRCVIPLRMTRPG